MYFRVLYCFTYDRIKGYGNAQGRKQVFKIGFDEHTVEFLSISTTSHFVTSEYLYMFSVNLECMEAFI